MAKSKKTSSKSRTKSVEDMSVEELRAALAEREQASRGNGTAATSVSRSSQSSTQELFSVIHTLHGKKIFMIGGTGFLGRVMLYMFLKYVPGIERIYLLIRPTHGRTGDDRLMREILESPVFTEAGAGSDEEARFFREQARAKITVVEGDASRPGLGLSEEDAAMVCREADAVFNTAGNVEFNPPLDLSLNANAIATKEVLDFTETTQCKKYLHVSTCYVADRALHPDFAPEEIVLDRVVGSSGNEVRIDVEQELQDARDVVARTKQRYDDPDSLNEYRDNARRELRRMGREDVSDRLIEKTAKNLRTLAMREELVRIGRERAERLNRPNVYTYTKTLAELLVKSREDKIEYTIVRPSIVETSLKHPFPGWNEGIQGSAPLIYMVYRGHRMLPSFSDEPGERREATLDIIPVDLVAAGSTLALCALLRGEQKDVYQLAAGPIDTPITPNVLLNIVQHNLRNRSNESEIFAGLGGWLRRNLQAYPVTKKTFRRFSSPRTLQVLTNFRDRLERFRSKRNLPGPGSDILQKVQTTVERFYQLSYMKNRIFSEFLPFMNHGYPVFQNRNGIDLYKRLPENERDLFYFDPPDIDFIDYMEGLHMEAVFQWVFPVLDKRFKAITSIGKDAGKNKDDGDARTLLDAMRAALTADDLEFTDRLHLLRRTMRDRRRARGESAKKSDAGIENTPAEKDPGSAVSWLESHLQKLAGRTDIIKNLKDESDDYLERVSKHLEFLTGTNVTPATLKDLGSVSKIARHLDRYREDQGRTGGGRFELPKDGVDVPRWLADPTSDFLYGLQMWFYRNVMQVKITGQDNVPLNNHNVIVVANHASHLDYGLVWFSLGEYARDMGILAARDYFFDRFWKSTFFGNFLNLVPIERSDNASYSRALKHAVKYLEKGGPLLIFPEGTRSKDGRMKPFRHGLGWLVQHTGADVLPLRLYNTHVALPKGKTVVRSTDLRVHIGKLVSYDTLAEETQAYSPTKTYAHIAKRLEEAVRDIHDHD